MEHLRFNLNGEWIEERQVSPTTTLLRYLRDRKNLTGTKEGCAEGDCGACTVAVAENDAAQGVAWRAINSCLLMLPMLQGKHVLTVEALKSGDQDHPAQVAMAKALGSQCGSCTAFACTATLDTCFWRVTLRILRLLKGQIWIR